VIGGQILIEAIALRKTKSTRMWILPLFLLLPILSAPVLANEIDCGNPFVNHFGPFDYRIATVADKELVERFHFTPETEQLKAGSGTGIPAQDIGYTLGVFPNHPRALVAMYRLAIREKSAKPKGAKYSIDCYLDRAMRFRPDDSNVYLIFGTYLLNIGQAKNAVELLEKSLTLNDESANAHYNLGLAFFDLHDYENSLAHAQRAYVLGFPLPGLRNKLEKAGKWQSAPSPVTTVPGG
jgi:tetratricopeptide (TPR) repeat protein